MLKEKLAEVEAEKTKKEYLVREREKEKGVLGRQLAAEVQERGRVLAEKEAEAKAAQD